MSDENGPVSRRVETPRRKRALVAGSTGLVGAALTTLLTERADVETTALVRKSRGREGVTERVFDYDSDADYAALANEGFDVLFLCLGTTRSKAGSDEAFRRVDLDYPTKLLNALAPSLRAIGLVSSVGAASGRGLYLRTKLDLEKRVAETGVRHAILRPSFLVGAREEFRLGEKIGLATVAPILRGLGAISSGMKRYAPIRAEQVGRALAAATLDGKDSVVLEGAELFAQSGP